MKHPRVRHFRHAGRGLLVLAMVGGGCGAASALESTMSLGYSLDYTDNARLSSANEKKEWTNTLFGEVNLLEKNVFLDAELSARGEYHDYRNDIFGDETVGSLNGLLNWHILPGRFDWIIENFYTQSAINPTEPDTPTNRQGTNVFNTGPDVTLRLSSVHSLNLGARYTNSTYKKLDLDNTRILGTVGWSYEATPRTIFSLNGEAESVDYDNELLNTNFDREDIFAQILHRITRNQVLLEGGVTQIDRPNQPEVEEGRYRLTWTRELTATSIFKLSTTSEVSDVTREALAVGEGTAVFNPALTGGVVSSDVFRTIKHEAEYTRNRATSVNTIGFFWHEDDFYRTPTLEQRRGGHLIYGYDFTGTFSGELFGSYRSTKNFNGTVLLEYRDIIYGIRILKNLTRNFRLDLELQRNEREHNDPLSAYTEHRGLITLTYFSGPTFRRLR